MTQTIYIPLLLLLHLPLNLLIIYQLYIDPEGLASDIAPILRFLLVTLEMISIFTQFLYALWVLIFSEWGRSMIIYSDILWRQIVAGLGIVIIMFVCNDIGKVMMIAYMNRPEVMWIPIFQFQKSNLKKTNNINHQNRLILRIV